MESKTLLKRGAGSPVALVTGCSGGGIGYALCVALAARGVVVFPSARRLEAMADLDQVEGVAQLLQLDVTDDASIRSAVEAVLREAGRIDILINNAGVGMAAITSEVDIAQARRVYDANVWGVLALTQAVVPHMVERRSGCIVNVGSVVGYSTPPFRGIYGSSKAAVHAMSDALRLELAPFGVHVMVLAPGLIATNLQQKNEDNLSLRSDGPFVPLHATVRKWANLKFPRATPPEQFAKASVRAILARRKRAHVMIGFMCNLFKVLYYLPVTLRDHLVSHKYELPRNIPLETTRTATKKRS